MEPTNVSWLPHGVEHVRMMNGTLAIKAAPDLLSRDLTVRAGARNIALTALSRGDEPEDDTTAWTRAFPLDPQKLVKDKDSSVPGLYDICLNGLEEWALENSQTLQIRLDRHDAPMDIRFASTLPLPDTQDDVVFRAALAVHRAEAEFHIHLYTKDNAETQTLTVPFDPAKPGGQRLAGYQTVAISLPTGTQAARVSFSIRFKRYVPEIDIQPFLFIAAPRLTVGEAATQTIDPIILAGPSVPGAQWVKAELPDRRAAPRETVRLITPQGDLTVFKPDEARLTLVEDQGHSLILRASAAQAFAFCLNGSPAFQAYIGEDNTAVRLPPLALTGATQHLTIRDRSGSQVFLETYIQPPRQTTPLEILQRETRPPFPGPLFAQAAHRYAGLKAHLDYGTPADGLNQLSHVLTVLEGGHDRVTLKPLAFPKVDRPEVSVIIPAHNKVAVTYYALCGLLLAHNRTRYEVIVVDDASTDETVKLEKIVSGIRVIHNREPLRFNKACNRGVAEAAGRYVVLLNNDTEPTVGWLDALVEAFERFPKAGLVGSKLLYPDGALQDAGGILWASGNPWNYGNRHNPWEPRFCYARQADYLCGAALMTTKEIWAQVGGFSDYLAPMYFEDTDLAFKIRDAGYTTWFVPSSIVYHFEGATSGTDPSKGFKRHQEINRPKFKRRWAKAFAEFSQEGKQPDLEKDRGIAGRILFIDYTTPCPDRDAGGYAALQEIKLVQSLGYKVTFLPQNLAYLGSQTETLQRAGVEMVYAPFTMSVGAFLEQRAEEFDVFYITRYYVGAETIDQIRRLAPNAKIILNNADLHFLRQLRAGLALKDPEKIAEVKEVREQELAVMLKSDVVLSYNDVEHTVIQSHTDGAVKVAKCPWVINRAEAGPPMKNRAGISFLGSFRHHPNTEGITWFAREVMPLLNEGCAPRAPKLVLSIYGSGMDETIRALASDTVRPEGFIENVSDAYHRHRVFVAPLLSGAGVKGKVLAALAHGVPCVLSPFAAEGIGLRDGFDCLIASQPFEWVEAIHRVYNDAALWRQISDNARSFAESNFSFDQGRVQMRAVLEAADIFTAAA